LVAGVLKCLIFVSLKSDHPIRGKLFCNPP
jgi:hypothetical protein